MRPFRLTLAVAIWVSIAWAAATGSERAPAPPLTDQEKTVARKLYVRKCAKCHRFYDPNGYTEDDWRRWSDSMNRKAKLRPDSARLLERYLDAYRAGEIDDLPGTRPRP